MKVVRVHAGAGNLDRVNAKCFHVDHTILNLQPAFNVEEAVSCDNDTFPLEEIGRDDDVGNSGFVFERKKYKPFRCARSLAGNYASCNAHKAIVISMRKVIRRKETAPLQGEPMIRHRMRTAGKAGAGKIGSESFVDRHFAKRFGLIVDCGNSQ